MEGDLRIIRARLDAQIPTRALRLQLIARQRRQLRERCRTA
jgi:hypothetical protein